MKEEWVGLMHAYKLLGEHGNIKAIVEEQLELNKKISSALEMQVSGELQKASGVWKEVIENAGEGMASEVREYLEK